MSNQNREYGKRKELNVQSLACTFTLSNIDAYFRVNDERVTYKSKVVASGMMYRIFGQNTDILVFVDTIPYIRNNAMSYAGNNTPTTGQMIHVLSQSLVVKLHAR